MNHQHAVCEQLVEHIDAAIGILSRPRHPWIAWLFCRKGHTPYTEPWFRSEVALVCRRCEAIYPLPN